VEDAMGPNATMSARLTRMELELDEQLEVAMRQLWSDVNDEGKRASEKLHNLTSEIMLDFQLEGKEMEEFNALYGEGADYHAAADAGYHGGDADDPDGLYDNLDDEDTEEIKMTYALHRLQSRLEAMVRARADRSRKTCLMRACWLAWRCRMSGREVPASCLSSACRRSRVARRGDGRRCSARRRWSPPAPRVHTSHPLLPCPSIPLPPRAVPPSRQPNISLPEAEITEWEDAYAAALDAMGDESKEADLRIIQEKLAARLQEKGIKVRRWLPRRPR